MRFLMPKRSATKAGVMVIVAPYKAIRKLMQTRYSANNVREGDRWIQLTTEGIIRPNGKHITEKEMKVLRGEVTSHIHPEKNLLHKLIIDKPIVH